MANEQSSRFLHCSSASIVSLKIPWFGTPAITALILILVMLGSVVLANRISIIGSTMLERAHG